MNGQTQDQKQKPVYLEPHILEHLKGRRGLIDIDHEAARGWLISTTLDRYFHLISERGSQLRQSLSDGEVGLMIDACNGALWHSLTIQYLPDQIVDAIKLDRLDEKWDVDGAALVAKLKAMDLLSLFTLVDAIERFWSGKYNKEKVDIGGLLS